MMICVGEEEKRELAAQNVALSGTSVLHFIIRKTTVGFAFHSRFSGN